jgi:hypothetical protein
MAVSDVRVNPMEAELCEVLETWKSATTSNLQLFGRDELP